MFYQSQLEGSKISIDKQDITIGPESVGKSLTKEAICFGGKIKTLTDISLVLNPNIINSNAKVNISINTAQRILNQIFKKIRQLIFQMEEKEKNLPIIVVGGGAILFENNFLDKKINIPNYYYAANAYGAALAEISATEDIMGSLRDREKVLNEIKQKAISKAIAKGANLSKVRIVDLQIIPYHYIPNFLARVVVTAMGRRE